MERFRREATHEHEGNQVQKTAHQSRNAVLRDAVNAGAVGNRHFSNAEALPLGHDRDKTVVVTVKLDKADHGTTVSLDAAVEIVEALAAYGGHGQVEKLGRPRLVPRVQAANLPTRNKVETAPFLWSDWTYIDAFWSWHLRLFWL